jgi:hypothetical protein
MPGRVLMDGSYGWTLWLNVMVKRGRDPVVEKLAESQACGIATSGIVT